MYREDRTLSELEHNHNPKSQARLVRQVPHSGGVLPHRAANVANAQRHEGYPAANVNGLPNQADRPRRYSSTNPVFRRLTYPVTQLGL